MTQTLQSLRQHLLTGVSYTIPFIAAGGILIALSLAFAPMGAQGPDMNAIQPIWLQDFLKLTLKIGETSFGLMLPILGGYIAFSIAGKPGLVAGMIGGFLSGNLRLPWAGPEVKAVSAGFLGALAAGLIAGFLVNAMKKIPANRWVKPIMPILIIPVLSSVAMGAIMLLVVGPPIAEAMAWMAGWLNTLSTGNAVVLAMILGAMIAFDMGGPVNKAAFFFASGLIAAGNTKLMGPVAAAICTPPLGMGLATFVFRKQWDDEQRNSGVAAMGMGMIGITEGAIPFAAADPLRVIPSIMVGSMTAATIAMLGGVGNHAPHGGPIVLPVIDGRLLYVVAIVAGTITTAFAIGTLKRLWRAPGEKAA